MQLGQRHVDPALRLLALSLEGRGVEAETLEGVADGGQQVRGLVDGRLRLQQAGLVRGAAGREVGAEHVTVAGDGGDLRVVADQAARRRQVVDDDHAGEQALHGGPEVVGALHDVRGVRRPGEQVSHGQARGVCLHPGAARRIPARPRSSALRWSMAPRASSTPLTATASAALPRAAATADS